MYPVENLYNMKGYTQLRINCETLRRKEKKKLQFDIISDVIAITNKVLRSLYVDMTIITVLYTRIIDNDKIFALCKWSMMH